MRCLLAAACALLLTAPASARDLPAETSDPVARVDRDATLVISNGSRTFLWGDFDYAGAPAPSGAIVSARSGTTQTLVADGRDGPVADPAGGWYASRSGGVVRLRPDGSADPAFAVTLSAGDSASLALAGPTLWLAGRFHSVNGEPRTGVAAVDAATGQVLPWRHDGEASELAVAGDTVYVAADAGVLALDAMTGAERARADIQAPVALALAGPTVYVGDYWGRVIALDAATLSERWRVPSGVGVKDLAVTGGGVYVTGTGGVARFDATTGERSAWSTPITSAWSLALSPDGATAYVTRAEVPGWAFPGAVAFATGDGALLGWAPGPEGAHTNGGIAVSHDGTSVFLGAVPTLGTRYRPAGGVVLDETGLPTPSVPPTRGNLTLDARNTVYTPLGAFWPDGSSRWSLAFAGGSGVPALSADEQTVYLTGKFTAVNGEPRANLAAVQAADGSVLSWAPQVTGGHTTGLVAAPDGRTLYVMGTFTAIGGVPRAGLAALDAVSGAVLPFNPALDDAPGRIRLARDGSVLYVRLGTRLRGFRTSDGAAVFAPNVQAWDFVPLADGQTVIVAGRTDGYHPLTAWDVATSARVPWMEADCIDCEVSALALDPDGQALHVAGRLRGRHYLRLPIARRAEPPVNTWVPHIAGSAQAGRFVECDPGRWSGHPERYGFTWTIDGVPVPGFDGREFLLESTDVGHYVTCEVRADGAAEHAKSEPLLVTGPASATARRVAVPLAQDPLTPGPAPFAVRAPDPGPRPGSAASVARVALVDRLAPDVALRRIGRSLRVTLSERAALTATLRRGKRTYTRRFTLAGGRHTFTARRLKVPHGRYTLTLRARDAAGNVASRRVLRLSV